MESAPPQARTARAGKDRLGCGARAGTTRKWANQTRMRLRPRRSRPASWRVMACRLVPCEPAEHLHRALDRSDVRQSSASLPAARRRRLKLTIANDLFRRIAAASAEDAAARMARSLA